MLDDHIDRRDHALTAVDDFHEMTRLYPDARRAWGRRVAYFNTNEKARARLLDEHRDRFGSAWQTGDTAQSADLAQLLTARKSHRQFASAPASFERVKDVMVAATCAKEGSAHRPYASAGGIYSVDHYLIGLRVDGPIQTAFVAYCCPKRCALMPVRTGLDPATCRKALGLSADDEIDPAFVVIQTMNLERATRKYQQRGYRFALLEAGLAAQNMCLLADANGFGALIWGGHHDDMIDQLLSIHGTDATAINTILMGGHTR
ncbi:SagB/ThcOx family dehydrogenase [Tateyamaria sp. SN3-11]|uniref:SagB/ThcOx family dehydrogenase n=1 Tax=Tateyamaria sp. SN3-11 TaxID=3092147 RepID=UPI0039EC9BE4